MTANQLAYWRLEEDKRANRAREGETHRSNLVNERETNRSNVAREREANRSNLAKEGIESTRNSQNFLLGKLNYNLSSKMLPYNQVAKGTESVSNLVGAVTDVIGAIFTKGASSAIKGAAKSKTRAIGFNTK